MRANAKINIGLNIVGKRADGYHNLETIFMPIGLADELQFAKSEHFELIQDGQFCADCPVEKNLVYKAYKALCDAFPEVSGVSIRLTKNVPFGAGLGGGSSDAAKTLLGLNELFGLGLSREQLLPYAARLGADCAFFLYDSPCYAEGIGERLTELKMNTDGATPSNPILHFSFFNLHLVLIKPNVSVSTKEAYAGVKIQQPAVNLRDLIQLPIEQWQGRVVNDFEQSIFPQYPEIQAVRDKLLALGASYASMTGSGASVYAFFKNDCCPSMQVLQSSFPDMFIYVQ